MTPPISQAAGEIARSHPEWRPWLSLVERTLAAAADPRWESLVPAKLCWSQTAPLLAGTSILLPPNLVDEWVAELAHAAARCGTPEMSTLAPLRLTRGDILALFRAALGEDRDCMESLARRFSADPDAFAAVADLLPIPFLQAARRLAPQDENSYWQQGYCRTCGAWPAFAEVRGIERARYLRCARCGDQWQMHWLQCPFCGLNDHEQMQRLVPQTGDASRAVDACNGCRGYLKSFNVLQGTDPLSVLLRDLGSVDLDIAAVQEGYRRPPRPGHLTTITVDYKQGAHGR